MARSPRLSTPARILAIAALLALAGVQTGCVLAPSRSEVSASRTRAALPGNLALAPIDAEVLRTDLRGKTGPETQWDAEITNHFLDGLRAALRLEPARATAAPLASETVAADLARVRAQTRDLTARHAPYSSVHSSHSHFDIGAVNVGRIDALADALQADAVVFVYLSDRSSSEARRAAAVVPTLVALPTGVNLPPRAGVTVASLAVVTREGDVRWFNVSSTVRDLRFPEDAARLAQRLVADLDRSR